MTRFAFATWDGGGNVPPAVGIAQELRSRGHDVVFIGYEVQRQRLETKGYSFSVLPRSGKFDIYGASVPAERLTGLLANVWASADHLEDIPDAVAATSADVLIVDFSLQGALASMARLTVPTAVLAHSAISGLVPPPESPVGQARLKGTWIPLPPPRIPACITSARSSKPYRTSSGLHPGSGMTIGRWCL